MIKRIANGIMILLALCVSIGGCSRYNQEGVLNKIKTDNVKYTEFGEKLATKEYLVKTYGFKDSDFDGIDVEKVLSSFEISEEALRDSGDSKEFIIESFKKLQKTLEEEGKVQMKPSKPDYSYLVQAKEFKGEYPSFDEIKYLAFLSTEGNGGSSCFIDFEKDILLIANGSWPIYEDISRNAEKEELSKERKKNIIKSLKEARVDKWNYKYEVEVDNEEGDADWFLGMEFEDGTVISYSGNNDAPDTLYEIIISEIYK